MRIALLLALAACRGTTHTQSVATMPEQSPLASCAALTGIRRATCMRLGPPASPETNLQAASWWLYEFRTTENVPNCVECFGPPIVCDTYVAFDQDKVTESDELCRRVAR